MLLKKNECPFECYNSDTTLKLSSGLVEHLKLTWILLSVFLESPEILPVYFVFKKRLKTMGF